MNTKDVGFRRESGCGIAMPLLLQTQDRVLAICIYKAGSTVKEHYIVESRACAVKRLSKHQERGKNGFRTVDNENNKHRYRTYRKAFSLYLHVKRLHIETHPSDVFRLKGNKITNNTWFCFESFCDSLLHDLEPRLVEMSLKLKRCACKHERPYLRSCGLELQKSI